MERFLQRDNNVLVRYSPQRQSSQLEPGSSSSSSSSVRNSDDVDFQDVFGGPPRRYSTQDMRNSMSEAMDSSRRFRGEDEGISSSIRWSGLGEKPVFGEEGGNRRRNTSDDFFDDIFKGGEDKDPYASSPGSRIMSPARPLPPRAEPFGSSSLPAQFSLPAKLNKGMDLPSFASSNRFPHSNKDDDAPNVLNHPYSPSGSFSRLSSQSFQGQDESRNDTHSPYRQSPLSIEFSLGSDGSVKVTESEPDSGETVKKDLTCSDVPVNSSQFHFSIYKWASKGVPQMFSLRSAKGSRLKENNLSRCMSSNGRIECDNMVYELPTETLSGVEFSSSDSLSANTELNRMECKKEDNESLINISIRDKQEPLQSASEAVLAVPKQKPLDSRQSTSKGIPVSYLKEEKKLNALPETLCEPTENVTNKFEEAASKPELKPLRPMLFENDDERGIDVTTRGTGMKENMAKTTKKSSGNVSVGRILKKRDGKRIIHTDAEVDKLASLSSSPAHTGDNLERNKIKGKVKDFVKIFNHEAPSIRVTNAETQSQSFRRKDAGAFKAEKEVKVNANRADEVLSTPNMDKKKMSINTSVKVDKPTKQSQERDSGIGTTIHIINDTFEQKDSPSSTASITDGSKATLASIDDFFEDNFTVKELPQDQNKLPQSGKDEEDYKASDAKIRGWSNGKETNIRSLLSTLQYVLWPESGWKPVPLVDIIEGNGVKRAYQKALLCLHPDKLQQKGVAAHQKYIAEKVFDILQDAWTHFNSLGSL